ncbi:MAG: hypothetical protein IK093_16110, partial [Ruminiclostridium sp.]|nr:hypothetical protein [Ruminiclostridium sp.]
MKNLENYPEVLTVDQMCEILQTATQRMVNGSISGYLRVSKLLLCQESGQVKQTKSYQLTSLRSETRDLLYNFSKSSGERYP